MQPSIRHLRHLLALILIPVLAATCMDGGPESPVDGLTSGGPGTGVIALSPSFGFTGAAAAGEGEALAAAFDLIDSFRLVVTRLSTNEVVYDEIIEVTPGQDAYELSAEVPLNSAEETFAVQFIALQGGTTLFSSPVLEVVAVTNSVGTDVDPVETEMEYVGPGANAAAVELDRDALVLGPAAKGQVQAVVRDGSGGIVNGVPLGFSTGDPGVAAVTADGTVTGQAGGWTTLSVSTPTGVSTEGWVYVLDGGLAFVRDGTVRTASAASSESTVATPDATSAASPAYSADGGRLLYVEGGEVRDAATGGAVMTGGAPSLSPDGSKLAVAAGGGVVIANSDGSNPQPAFSGSNPAWLPGGEALAVGGGSIERVGADGNGRTTLVEESGARLPAVGPGGAVVYVGADGGVYVAGGGRLSPEGRQAGSRPTWSADGEFVVMELGGNLWAAPTGGDGPAARLPVGRGHSPAWAGSGFAEAPPEVVLTGVSPDDAEVGDEVVIEGSGFDAIIPENNRVTFPGEPVAASEGPARVIEAPVLAVTPTAITTTLPRGVMPGLLTVETFTGSGTLEFSPRPGRIAVTAETPSGTPVAGVGVAAASESGGSASGTTGADGTTTLTGLSAGVYTLEWTAPEGFTVLEATETATVDWGDTSPATAVLAPEVLEFTVDPDEFAIAVGESVDAEVFITDALGNPVTEGVEVRWRPLNTRVSVSASGRTATVRGVQISRSAGDTGFEVSVNGETLQVPGTVFGLICGRVVDGSGAPLEGIVVTADNGSTTTTDASGNYCLDDLFAGTYVVQAISPDERAVHPASHTVTIDLLNPTGQADFLIGQPTGGGDEVIVFGDQNLWGGNTSFNSADNRAFTGNLAPNEGRSTVVWWRGHNSSMVHLGATEFPGSYSISTHYDAAYDYITTTLGLTMQVVDSGSDITVLSGSASTIASLWIFGPSVLFTATEIQFLRDYVANGGRLILAGELGPSGLWSPGNVGIQHIMTQLGSPATYTESCLSGPTSDIETGDPLMSGVTSIDPGCTSYFTGLGAGDTPLARISGNVVVMRLGIGGSPPTVSPDEGSFDLIQGFDGTEEVETSTDETSRDLSKMDGTGRYDLDQ